MKNKNAVILLLFCVLNFCLMQNLHAKVLRRSFYGPLTTQSQNPLLLGFLAMPLESAKTLDQNQYEISTQLTFSNVFEYNQNGQTKTYLDMELWKTTWRFFYGLTHSLDFGFSLGTISQTAGFMDGFIQGYHNAFGFPNGGRELVNNNEFHFRIDEGATKLMDVSPTSLGLTDMTLRLKWQASKHIKLPFELALSSYIKLPTGKTSSGLSSGNTDAGLSFFIQKAWGRFNLVGQGGFGILGAHQQLSSIQKDVMFYFGQSTEWIVSNHLSLLLQFNGQTSPFISTANTDLSRINLDMSLGVSGEYSIKSKFFKSWFYQAAFAEDILSSGPSVDFSIYLLAGTRF